MPKNQKSEYAGDDTTIYPVILRVPEEKRDLKGREKVRYLSRYARDALSLSAEKSRIVLSRLPKDDDGIPQPVDGNYWSLTHKSEYVGGVVGRTKIGIDIEKIRSFSPGLFKKTANPEE